MGTRAGKSQRGKADDDAWERLMKIREKLGKTATSNEEVTERLAKIGEEIGKSWQSEKSAVEILSEMRR
jgi:hypothetical protein